MTHLGMYIRQKPAQWSHSEHSSLAELGLLCDVTWQRNHSSHAERENEGAPELLLNEKERWGGRWRRKGCCGKTVKYRKDMLGSFLEREREREDKYQVKVLKKPVSNDVLKMFKIWFIPSLVWILTLLKKNLFSICFIYSWLYKNFLLLCSY